jgi:uncharacterized protein YhbP (UPF0306 family)
VTGQDDRQHIENYLAAHNTVTLASCGVDGPWAAAVFFVSDANLTLYFKSDPKTRHMMDIMDDPRVAATVQDDGQAWQSIRGLQLLGSCSRVDDHDTSRVNDLYMEKFPFLGTVTDDSKDKDERVLAERVRKTPFYQLCPHWVRLIDNTCGFGHKLEISIS